MLHATIRRLGSQQAARKSTFNIQCVRFSSSFASNLENQNDSIDNDDHVIVAAPLRYGTQPIDAVDPNPVRSPEQQKAASLEYEGMLKLTDKVLALEQLESSNLRDFKLTLNYWTSVRAHHQVLLHDDDKTQSTENHELHAAPRLFEALMKRGDPSFIRQTIKTDEHAMGGLIYLIEHLLFAFRGTHQLMIVNDATKNTKHDGSFSDRHRDDLLNALLQASNVLQTMTRLQTDPDFAEIQSETNDDSLIQSKFVEMNLISKRVWFLKEFGDDELTDEQVELAFGGEPSISDCMTVLSCLVENFLLLDVEDKAISPHLSKLYGMIISTWVHSGLPESLDITLDLLNDMEEDERIGQLSPIPYSSVLYLCSKRDDAADIALPLWEHMRASDSGVEPDAATLAALLSCLISSNQLDEAISVLDTIEAEQGARTIQTNTMSYNIVLDGLVKSKRADSAERAEMLLQRMTELSETGINQWVTPDRITFSALMVILSKQGGGVRQVESVLMRCKSMAESNKDLEPDRIMYNIVLDSYAKQSEIWPNDNHKSVPPGPGQAEALLRTMESNPDTLPNTISYNSVLNVFAKSGVPFERMESILHEMNARVASGDDFANPDIITYNIILGAVARDGSKESLDKALSFMQAMRDTGMAPDRITFNNLMDSIVKADRPGAAVFAKQIMEKMKSDHDIEPDATSYNVVLNGFAKASSVEAAQQAEQILQQMLTLYQEHNHIDCRPDFVSYSSVLDAYARSQGRDAGFQAESLLNSMEQAGVIPNTICYNAALNCWAKSGHIDAPSRAEDLLDQMAQQESKNPTVKPNTVSFSTVMNCWAQSHQQGAAERTEAMLDRMELLAQSGNRDIVPGAHTYSTVISAWAKLGRADKALALLDRIELAYSSRKSPVRPNYACYNATMNAIAKSNSKNKAEVAASVLERMKSNFHKHGKTDMAPTPISYSSVINACAYTISDDPQQRAKAFRIARETFRDLLQSHEPTVVCYINFLTCCSRLLPAGKNREDMATAIFRDCQERGLANNRVESIYQGVVSRRPVKRENAAERGDSRPSWRSR